MNQETLAALILDLIDGSISPENFVHFENEMRSNTQAVETYVSFSRLENLLHVDSEINNCVTKPVIPMESILKKQRSKTIKMVLLSTAAVILVGVMVMNFFFVESYEPALAFKTSPGTQYSVAHDSSKKIEEANVMEEGSRLVITQGTVELTFKSGVKSIVSAPAELQVVSDEHIDLKEGSAWFQVPASAVGFQVTTKNVNVVDLGTEFGVHSRPDGDDAVHVFKGKVAVTTKHSNIQTVNLSANEARIAQDYGRLKTIKSDVSEFLTVLPNSLPHIHWSFDREDGFQAKGSHPDARKIVTTPRSSPRLVSGKVNQALALNGRGQHLTTDWAGILGDTPRSLSCWVKLDPNNPKGWGTIVEWGKHTMGQSWRCRVVKRSKSSAVLRLSLGNFWYDGSRNLADGKWHHVVVVDHGNSNIEPGEKGMQLYIDGNLDKVKKGRGSVSGATKRNTEKGQNLTIGISPALKHPTAHPPLEGLLDELYLFYGVISEEKISELSKSSP